MATAMILIEMIIGTIGTVKVMAILNLASTKWVPDNVAQTFKIEEVVIRADLASRTGEVAPVIIIGVVIVIWTIGVD